MRLGVKAAPHDAARFAQWEGVGFVETVLFGPDLEDLDATARAFADAPEVVVHSPFTVPDGREVDVASPDPALRDASLDMWERSWRLAERLDARWVIVHPGGIATRADAEGPHGGTLRADALERLEAALEHIGQGFGRDRLLLENMPDHYHRAGGATDVCLIGRSWADLASWRDLVAGFCLDVSHAWLTQGGRRNLDTLLARGAAAIRHLHLSDARRPDHEGLAFGAGDVPWDHYLPRLADLAGGAVTAVPEIKGGHEHDGAGFRAGLRFLRARL